MGSIELRYSRARLWMMMSGGLALAAFLLWLALDPTLVNRDGDRLMHRTEYWLAIGLGLPLCACLVLTALRLLGDEGLALRADARFLTVRSPFGMSTYRWSEVEELYLRRVSAHGVTQRLIMIKPCDGRARGVLSGLVRGGARAAEAWMRKVDPAARGLPAVGSQVGEATINSDRRA